MFNSITKFLARLTGSRSDGGDSFQPHVGHAAAAGDVLVQPRGQGWSAVKMIDVRDSVAHFLTYEPSARKPVIGQLAQAEIRIAHAQADVASFANGWELVGNQAATARELQGLKYMDFDLFLDLTGQDAQAIIQAANENFRRAGALGEEGRRTDSINEYGKAIELYPLFYEALDNRAFAFMELGLYQQALRDLDESLHIHPKGMDAFFSKGECLMKLGHLDEAEAIFIEGQERFPENASQFNEFLKRTRAFALTGRPA